MTMTNVIIVLVAVLAGACNAARVSDNQMEFASYLQSLIEDGIGERYSDYELVSGRDGEYRLRIPGEEPVYLLRSNGRYVIRRTESGGLVSTGLEAKVEAVLADVQDYFLEAIIPSAGSASVSFYFDVKQIHRASLPKSVIPPPDLWEKSRLVGVLVFTPEGFLPPGVGDATQVADSWHLYLAEM